MATSSIHYTSKAIQAEEHRLPVSSLKEPVSENLKQNGTLAASSDSDH